MHSQEFGRTGGGGAGHPAMPAMLANLRDAPTQTADPIGAILADCMVALANAEGLCERIDAKLFGERPVPCDVAKAAQEPPIESRCLGLRNRLQALVKHLEELSNKL